MPIHEYTHGIRSHGLSPNKEFTRSRFIRGRRRRPNSQMTFAAPQAIEWLAQKEGRLGTTLGGETQCAADRGGGIDRTIETFRTLASPERDSTSGNGRAFERPNPNAEKTAAAAEEGSTPGDRRRASRQRVLLAGKIVFNHGARSLDCAIRDLSDTGAKVRLAGAELVPGEVYLIEMRRGIAFEARVAWVRGTELGLELLRPNDLKVPTSPDLRTMRRLWIENVAR